MDARHPAIGDDHIEAHFAAAKQCAFRIGKSFNRQFIRRKTLAQRALQSLQYVRLVVEQQ
jgi:hypothetical protein